MKWQILNQSTPQTPEEYSQVLLANRKIADPEAFFNPEPPAQISLESLSIDPDQVELAVQRIIQARDKQQKIVVYGDYDADGINATAIMWQVLDAYGCDVMPFIPHRERHGYGVSEAGIEEIMAQLQPSLVITVDNGIVAHQPLAKLQSLGVEVIVTDHHQPDEQLPQATAVVHSTKLCGATVGWILARELGRALGAPKKNPSVLQDSLDLAAIATIADQVPLRDANRSFAVFGLAALRRSNRIGLKALAESAAVSLADIDTGMVNFVLAPRINAMGRLEHGLDALRLLCTTSTTTAKQLAQTLSDTNDQRKELTYDLVEHADAQAADWQDEFLIIVDSTEYHEGVVGLIAGRLAEKFHKPAIAISIGSQNAKASARSVPGINIVELIRLVRDDLLDVGGHPMAAGFGLSVDKLELVKQRLRQVAKQEIDAQLLEPSVKVDCLVPFELITEDLVTVVEQFKPFGKGNSEPIVGLQEMTVLDAFAMGRDSQHLKLSITRHPTDRPLSAIWWQHGSMAAELSPGSKIDLAAKVEVNEWNGKRSIQLSVKDILVAAS